MGLKKAKMGQKMGLKKEEKGGKLTKNCQK